MNKNNLSKNLYELRRKNNLSQEEMAEKLLVSRQAISKWERGEAYPDTENLIMISNIFNVTLDELIHVDLSTSEKMNDNIENGESNDDSVSKKVSVNMTSSELHIKVRDEEEDEDAAVNLTLPGIHIDANEKDDDENESAPTSTAPRICHALPYPIVITIAFLLIGFIADAWYWAWTLYITIPVYYSLIDAIKHRRLTEFAYPVFTAFIYCLIGMTTGAWHPWWLIFLTIPIYYSVAEAIDKWTKNKQ